VEYVNFSWTYVTLFKLVVRILVNKNLIRIGTIFLCSYDNFFPFVDKKEFDFSCKLSKFLLHLEGGGGNSLPIPKVFLQCPNKFKTTPFPFIASFTARANSHGLHNRPAKQRQN